LQTAEASLQRGWVSVRFLELEEEGLEPEDDFLEIVTEE